jgi:hypothetical protein
MAGLDFTTPDTAVIFGRFYNTTNNLVRFKNKNMSLSLKTILLATTLAL